MSTPSETALSIAAVISELAHPNSHQALQAAILEEYLIPLAEPFAKPNKLALLTTLPAAVEAV